MKLYSYYRSSAAYRVRIALNLKGLNYSIVAINLLNSEQLGVEYKHVNPQGLVPALALDDGQILTQSTAILEWLQCTYPQPSLLPKDELAAAKVRSLCNVIACDIHPLNNLRVLKYLINDLQIDEAKKTLWIQHWIHEGFTAIELQLAQQTCTEYCYGNDPSMADVYLIPQVFNALRFDTDLSVYPRIQAIYKHCNKLRAFIDAQPERQDDYPS